MIVDDKDQFLSYLDKTISWCNEMVDEAEPRACLRSSALKSIFEDYGEDINAAWLSSELIADLLRKRDLISNLSIQTKTSGRILLISYEDTNHNTLTESETDGYFDEHDNPPWDTWVCEIQCVEKQSLFRKLRTLILGSNFDDNEPPSGILVAWVPDCFIQTVQEGINVECSSMLFWADEKYPEPIWAPNYQERIPKWFQDLYQNNL